MSFRFFATSLLTILLGSGLLAQSHDQIRDSLLIYVQDSPPEDSNLVRAYLQLSRFAHSEPQKNLAFSRKASELSEKLGFPKLKFQSYFMLLNGHINSGSNIDSVSKVLEAYESELGKYGTAWDSMHIHWFYGFYYGNLRKTDKELESWLKALEIARRHEELKSKEGQILNNLGSVFYNKGEYGETLKYFKEALAISLRLGDQAEKHALGRMHANIGIIYSLHTDSLEMGKTYFERGYKFMEEAKDYLGMALTKLEEADILEHNNKLQEAEPYYFEALKLANSYGIGSVIPSIYGNMASHYNKRELHGLAVEYGEKAIRETKAQENFYDYEPLYIALNESYAKLGNYKKAFKIMKEYAALKDSINDLELQTKVEELETAFKVEQTEIENQLLKTQKREAERRLQVRTAQSFALVLGLLLVGTWAFFVYRSGRQKKNYSQQLEQTVSQRTHELEESNRELEQANYELKTFNFIASHDIKEPIRNIGNFVGLVEQKLPAKIKEELYDYFEIIRNGVKQLYILVEDFARYTAMSKDEEIEMVDVDLNGLVASLRTNLTDTLKVTEGHIVAPDMPVIHSSNSLLYASLKNLIENGLKFNEAPQPTVELDYVEYGEHHLIKVSDNGIGIAPKYQDKVFDMFKRLHPRGVYEGTGIGLAIVKLMMDKLGGKVRLQSEEGTGSTFFLEIPK